MVERSADVSLIALSRKTLDITVHSVVGVSKCLQFYPINEEMMKVVFCEY